MQSATFGSKGYFATVGTAREEKSLILIYAEE